MNPPAVSTASAETSYKLITPPDAPHYRLEPGQSAELPKAKVGHFAPPVYPFSLVHPGAPPALVKAQVVFGKNGRVRDVVILTDSYPGKRHILFEDAVRDAAAGWVFTPLIFTEYTGGGIHPVKLTREAKPFSLWFEFRFEIVNGKPSTSMKRH